jgi:hypothetical protein
MSSTNSIFEFDTLFGISSPLGNWQNSSQRGFVKDFTCNFKLLLGYIKASRDARTNANFRYMEYEGYEQVSGYTRLGPYSGKVKKDILFTYQKSKVFAKEEAINLEVRVNQWEGRVNFIKLPEFRLLFNRYTEKIGFSLFFEYEKYFGDNEEEKFAIILSANAYDDFYILLKEIGVELSEYGKSIVVNEFAKAFATPEVKNDANKIDWLYQNAPDFVLAALKPDATLYSDLVLLSKKSIDTDGTNENIAIVNLLQAIRDKAWFVAQVNKDPSLLRGIAENFSTDFFPNLLLLLYKIGADVWNEEDLKTGDNTFYIYGVQEFDFDGDGYSEVQAAGYSIYLKEKNLYQIGRIVHFFKYLDVAAYESNDMKLGEVSPYAPLKTKIYNQEMYIPAFVAETLTNIEIDKAKNLAVNNALFLLLPEFALVKLKTFTTIVNNAKTAVTKTIDGLVDFLQKINGEFKAVNLEKYGIKALFRGTTRNAAGELFLGNKNTIANGISTSTDPIRAVIFSIESATRYGKKGVLQIAIPKELKKLFLLPGNDRIAKELEVVLKTGANEFSSMIKIEIPVDDARRIIGELYDVHLPAKISPSDALNNSELLFRDIPRLTLEESYKFYKHVLK